MVLLCGIVITAGLAARAQCDDDDPDEAVVVEQFIITEQQFDRFVFGERQQRQQRVAGWEGRVIPNSYDAPPTTAFREQMELVLSYEMKVVDRDCSLTNVQMKKLNLAGRGDLVRLLNRLREFRKKCTSAAMNRQQYNELIMELQPLQYVSQVGPFGESSLFRKTLRAALSDDQLSRYRVLERERRVQAVGNALDFRELSANGLKLRGETRQKFIDTIVDHGNLPQTSSPYMQHIVWLEANRLANQLKPLLDETQWQTFQTHVTQAQRVEPTVRKLGLWPAPSPDDDDESPERVKRHDD